MAPTTTRIPHCAAVRVDRHVERAQKGDVHLVQTPIGGGGPTKTKEQSIAHDALTGDAASQKTALAAFSSLVDTLRGIGRAQIPPAIRSIADS